MPSIIAAASPLYSVPPLLDLPHQSRPSSSLFIYRPSFKIAGVSVDMRMRGWYSASDRSGFVAARCSKNWESKPEFDLEAEIMEFMRSSGNPHMFPTKKQLIDSGRKDLVDAIVAQGGWLSLGWASDAEDGLTFHDDFDFRTLVSREQPGLSSLPSNPSSPPSYSEVSQESSSEESSGVDGILSRLEKEREITFGLGLRDKVVNHSVSNDKDRHYCSQETQADETLARYERRLNAASLSFSNGTVSSLGDEVDSSGNSSIVNDFRNTHQTEQWRTWSSQRSGFSNEDFEAGEVNAVRIRGGESRKGLSDHDEARDGNPENFDKTKDLKSPSPRKKIGSDQIKGRLQNLETELSSVLQSLRSKVSNSDDPKDLKPVPEDLQELSDAWEFQENEIMHAKDKLRSIRAKLAVMEGKMALSIIDAKKTIEQKQKRIDEARRAQRLLRNACIVWHNPANEVLLAGSFDGWASQRKMDKSSSGIFSICLKLYPGRYEIKFIVDGVWKVDPLRPIVHDNGFENNLITVT